jgi:DTW domain-containing protein YfiP
MQSQRSDFERVHPITRLAASCARCGLPAMACLCGRLTSLTTRARFVLLTSRKELARASNTGRLLRLLNPERTEILVWERDRSPQALLQHLQAADVWLVYPPEQAGPQSLPDLAPGAEPVFVLLDGTWQEARKMIRKSAYLAKLPRLALAAPASGYALRANHRAGTLCTIGPLPPAWRSFRSPRPPIACCRASTCSRPIF